MSNTTPVLNLARIGQLDLLKALFESVRFPSEVMVELERNLGGECIVGRSSWLIREPDINNALETLLLLELDPGEASAIALAVERKAGLLLMDEKRGRQLAARLGLRVMGTVGALVLAKRRGILRKVKPVLNDFVVEAGFWLAPSLQKRILAEVNEA